VPERRSPTHSPEPPSLPVVIPPEEPQGRSFRNRTAAQLNPYSIEQAKYTRSLLRNGWQGAVVAGPRRGEETPEELHRRKLAAAQAPKDDLGGWLEYEDGQIVGGRASSAPPETFSDDTEDGLDLLAREALRKSRLVREVDAALRGGPSRPNRGSFLSFGLRQSSAASLTPLSRTRQTTSTRHANFPISPPYAEYRRRPSKVDPTSRRAEPTPPTPSTARARSVAAPIAAIASRQPLHRHLLPLSTIVLRVAERPLPPSRSTLASDRPPTARPSMLASSQFPALRHPHLVLHLST
jgi:hypothetical protein